MVLFGSDFQMKYLRTALLPKGRRGMINKKLCTFFRVIHGIQENKGRCIIFLARKLSEEDSTDKTTTSPLVAIEQLGLIKKSKQSIGHCKY